MVELAVELFYEAGFIKNEESSRKSLIVNLIPKVLSVYQKLLLSTLVKNTEPIKIRSICLLNTY
jgi:hypothetical protein